MSDGRGSSLLFGKIDICIQLGTLTSVHGSVHGGPVPE